MRERGPARRRGAAEPVAPLPAARTPGPRAAAIITGSPREDPHMNRRHSVVFSLFTAALSAQGINEFPEPNDSPGTATPMAPGLQAQGAIGFAGDKDWYLFGISAPS